MEPHYITEFINEIKWLSYECLGAMDNLCDYLSGSIDTAGKKNN